MSAAHDRADLAGPALVTGTRESARDVAPRPPEARDPRAVAREDPAALVDSRHVAEALVPAVCALCRDDFGVPVAVGANFADPDDAASYLVLRCRQCRLLYLSPRPASVPRSGADPDVGRILGAWLRDGPRGVGQGGRVLAAGLGAALAPAAMAGVPAAVGRRWHVDAGSLEAAMPAAYDAVVFAGTLERFDDPVATLSEARAALRRGGFVVVIGPNAAGPAARLYAGRYWAGYDFPRRRYFFDATTLRAAAARAGLDVERLTTRVDGDCWARSLDYLLADVGGDRHPAERAEEGHRTSRTLLRALGTALDAGLALVGRGARLHATLRPRA
ncbi:MAG TPA: methyltransferase domain-containing protein [Gemmatirosa sp.]